MNNELVHPTIEDARNEDASTIAQLCTYPMYLTNYYTFHFNSFFIVIILFLLNSFSYDFGHHQFLDIYIILFIYICFFRLFFAQIPMQI